PTPAATRRATLSLHDALPILGVSPAARGRLARGQRASRPMVCLDGSRNQSRLSPPALGRGRPSARGRDARTPTFTPPENRGGRRDRKSTRLNSSHQINSYAVF